MMAFLDISCAYDSVEHQLLWEVLREQGLPTNLQQNLEALYADNEAVIH